LLGAISIVAPECNPNGIERRQSGHESAGVRLTMRLGLWAEAFSGDLVFG
jgi:hypothetical protein